MIKLAIGREFTGSSTHVKWAFFLSLMREKLVKYSRMRCNKQIHVKSN